MNTNAFAKTSLILLLVYFTMFLITILINWTYIVPITIGWIVGIFTMAILRLARMI